ncbi:hypothetical protein B566_EDAN003797 [Ephemera danica]|nr:hypothetical protein B566_EDAN003797 [Ephemera danica]
MELGARRERLQRQGQQLQDSFAEAWQAQAALAQSLVGRARLLRRGMATGEQQPSSGSQSPSPGSSRVAIAGSASVVCPVVVSCDPPPVPAAVVTSPAVVVDCQDPVAEKLEHALTSRTREIQSLRSELLRGPATAGGRERSLRPPSGTDSHLSSSLNSLQTRDVELEVTSATLNKSFLPRQSSEELAELPHLLTDKVLELKRGLIELCAAAHNREPEICDVVRKDLEQITHPEPPSADEEVDETDATTATFVLRVGGWKRGPSESSSSTPIVSSTSVGQGSPTSPVASVTIRPPFWRRVAVDRESSSSESEPGDEGDKSESDDNDVTSPKKVDEEATSLRKSKTDDSSNRILNRTDSKDETSNNGGRRCSLRRMSKLISEETRDAWRQHQYVTTVSATATSPEAKKLKTRRVSDTHVAYKSQENPNASEPSSPINVFVPTTRKIFSPVQGKTDESIIGYVISDSSGNIPEKTAESSQVIPWRRRSSTEAENSTKSTTNCVAPWRRTRDSQSASPAMPRKIRTAGSFSPESSPRARRLHVDSKNESSPLPPPFPRSPTPNRRADQKNSKEGSSSIKLMIAKYNQKLEKPGTPVPISPSYSPAWRSPVAERRDLSGVVRTQMEKYQEEVRRALQQGFSSSRRPTAVQKSASAGIIRCPSASTIPQREPPPLLKSSSAGAIKSPILPLKRIPDIKISNEKIDSEPSSPLDQSIDTTIQAYRKNTMSPKPVSSKSPHSPCMRALKLRRAREEFLTRGPGAFRTSEPGCRLSQASAGSGSSFEDLLLDNEGIVKSASAGMIHVQAEVYKRLTEPENQDQKPSTSKSESKSKFGLSSLASKFRKVRLRKKERLNTVSMLCRQSLLVDLDDSRRQGQGSSQDQTKATLKPSTSGKESVSCPNSPVLEHKTIWIKRHKKEK